MRHDDDRYFRDDEENDLWDDELDLDSDPRPPVADEQTHHSYAPHTPYAPYSDEYGDRDGDGYEKQPQLPHTSEDNEPYDYYSDPAPKKPEGKRRGGFFKRKAADEEEDDNDYYDSDPDPDPDPVPARKPKTPRLDPEDPDYWVQDDEESPISGIIGKPPAKWKWKLAVWSALLLALLGAWIWFLRPYSDGAVKYGYIKDMERRGSILKTFEGTMIPYKELGDPDPFYFKEMRFSVESDSLAAVMKRMMLGCVPVRVEYKTYHTPLPWKGDETMIIVKADTADPKKILPPEYRH